MDSTKVKSEKLDKERGPRGPYTVMEAAKVIHLKTILDGSPAGMNFIGYKRVEEFNRISYIECTRFEVVIYEDGYGIRHDYFILPIIGRIYVCGLISSLPDAAWFVEQIGLLYMIEADVTEILATLHGRAGKMIKNRKRLHYGDLMNKALNYMLNGWPELQNYRMDGHYTIDNMIAERVIRPFTVIETAKMHGLEVRDYLVHVFREIMNGNKDCSTYAPEAFLA